MRRPASSTTWAWAVTSARPRGPSSSVDHIHRGTLRDPAGGDRLDLLETAELGNSAISTIGSVQSQVLVCTVMTFLTVLLFAHR